MSTITWTEVIDTTTGRIYADCNEVERRTGVPALLVDACIKTGKAINGHCFDLVTRQASAGSCGHTINININSRQQEERLRKRRERERRRLERERAGLVRLPLTDELKADCIRQYEAGVPLRQIARSTGRVSICTRDLTKWNGGVPPKRPEGYTTTKRGTDICINDKRPVWESSGNPSCATVDGPEGEESGDSSPA